MPTRRTVLVAGHAREDEHEQDAERPADQAQENPAQAHLPPFAIAPLGQSCHVRAGPVGYKGRSPRKNVLAVMGLQHKDA
jgi:hypothetical protein